MPSEPLRLKAELQAVHDQMESSHEVFSSQVTELKMDHDNGQRETDKLKQFLGIHISARLAIDNTVHGYFGLTKFQ